MTMTARDWGLLVLLSILWGGTFFFVSIAVREMPPLTVVLLRVGIGAGLLFVFLRWKGEVVPKSRQIWAAFFAMGFLNNVIPFSLFFWAQTTIPGALASIVNGTTPIFSILIAHFCLADERFTANKFAGVLLAIMGVAFLLGEEVVTGASIATVGLLACFLAAIFQGAAVVYGRRFQQLGLTGATGALGQLLATTIIMTPIAALIEQPWSSPLPSLFGAFSILGLAVLSTSLAYVIFFHLLATAGAVNASLVTLLIPASAILLGIGFLDESLFPSQMTGLGFISLGLLVVDGRILDVRWIKRGP
ncbi:MAG: DMT family transporter [Pseudomonadota bacterium]